jgi:predicted RNA-binding protein YlxR (DUF448 family)
VPPHVPQRTCVGCRRRAGKLQLLRIARSGGSLTVDVSASAPGRGAYVHPEAGCVEVALERGGLARALRTGLRQDEMGRLKSDIEAQMGAS